MLTCRTTVSNGHDNKYDVAIIGAGIAGLTAGVILARAGLRTAIFEKEHQPGGCLASFKRKGFTFDTSLQWLNQCRLGGFLYRIHNYLGTDGPRYKALTRIHRYNCAGRTYLLTSNPLEFRDHLIRDYPEETAGLTRLFADAGALGQHMRFLDDRMRGAGTMTTLEMLSHGLAMTRWVWPVRRYVTTPAAQGLKRYFRNRELLNLFHSEGTMMSVLVPIGFAFTGDFQAPPDGGSSTIIDWLVRKFAAAGGTLELNQPAGGICINSSRQATGIRLISGREISADRVIAACDAASLFSRMIPAGYISTRWHKRLQNADLYYSCFSIYIGLNTTPGALGLNEELVHITDDTFSPDKRANGDAATTVITVLAPSARDPSLAPPGKGTLLIHCPAYLKQENNWRTGPGLERGEDYRVLKDRFAATLIDRVERTLIPGLRSHIEVMEAATPVTFQRYTGNRDGSIMGHRPTRENIRAGLATIKTPVKRLFLGGQWAEYGGGVPMATKAAVNASLAILKDLRPEAFDTLKKVVDGTLPPCSLYVSLSE